MHTALSTDVSSRFRFLAFLLCGAVSCSCAAQGLDPQNEISQYGHTAWRMQDGVFASKPTSIAQTADGYIWLGTANGLIRFDGVRFTPWDPPDGQKLPDSRIWNLLAAKDGSLWIGTQTTLVHLVNGKIINVPINTSMVESMFENEHGILWITRAHVQPTDKDGALCEVSGVAVHCHGALDEIRETYAEDAIEDSSGNIWLVGDAVTKWHPGSAVRYAVGVDPSLAGLESPAQAVTLGRNDSIWVGMLQPGRGLGLQHLVNGIFSPVVLPGFDSSTLKVATLFTDSRGDVWVGTMDHGMYRVQDGNVSHFGATDGLSSDAVYNFFEDREGNLWIITSEGLDRLRNLPVATFTMQEGLSVAKASVVAASRDGSIWIGNYFTVDVLRGGKITSIGAKQGFDGTLVTTMMEDRDGRMWIAIDDKLYVAEQGRLRRIDMPADLSKGVIGSMAQDSAGDIWFARDRFHTGELIRFHAGQFVEQKFPPETQGVFSLAPDPHSGLWVGMRDGDLAHFQDGVWQVYPEPHSRLFNPLKSVGTSSTGFVLGLSGPGMLVFRGGTTRLLTSKNGLPCDGMNSFVTDLHGSLFLNTKCGILVIAHDELERWWNAPKSTVSFRLLGPLDGARTELSNLTPAAAASRDGRVWFANGRTIQVIDPNALGQKTLPPPVAVESVIENGKQYPKDEELKFAPHLRSLQIDYTALSFALPQRVFFRYRLDGHDPAWQDAGTRRSALYNDLPPGRYQFRVIACNDAGVWNETGATLSFVVPPTIYQTVWFKGVVALFIGIGLWMLYLMRIRQATEAVQARLGERLAERERIARELHDTLLQGFYSLLLVFETIVTRMPESDPHRLSLAGALDRADGVLQEGRARVRDLRSEDENPQQLAEVLNEFGTEMATNSGIHFNLTVVGSSRLLNNALREDSHQIAREALLNAFRHAQATSINVEICYERSRFLFRIRDDGKGISPEIIAGGRKGHWGLSGMRERARKIGGVLHIESRVGAGTLVSLSMAAKLAYTDSVSRAS